MVRAALVDESSHWLKTYWVAAPPDWGVEKVTWQEEPGVHGRICGEARLEPGAQPVPVLEKRRLLGLEETVTLVVSGVTRKM